VTVSAMNVNNFLVRPHRREVEQFADRAAWDNLKMEDYARLGDELAGLPNTLPPEDETAKRFDLIILKLQLATLTHDVSFKRLRDTVREIAAALQEKKDIPMVAAQLALLLEIQKDEWWANVTLPLLEDVRKRVRDLVKFIDKVARKIVVTDFEDVMGTARDLPLGVLAGAVDVAQYKKKMLHFLDQHKTHIALRKLRENQPLTPTDVAELERLLFESADLGDRAAFEKAYGKQERLGAFLRRLVGLDREAAKRAFAAFLNDAVYTGPQIRFVNLIVENLTRNGVMDPAMLYEAPYTDLSPTGLDGLFKDDQAEAILQILSAVDENAGEYRASA
jgi:type I restriction enzyme R subunit